MPPKLVPDLTVMQEPISGNARRGATRREWPRPQTPKERAQRAARIAAGIEVPKGARSTEKVVSLKEAQAEHDKGN